VSGRTPSYQASLTVRPQTALTTPFAALSRLRTFSVSIPPSRTALFAELYGDTASTASKAPADLLAAAHKSGTLPTTKDFRRFIKKAPSVRCAARYH
jgi:hypothetical protein